MTDNIALRLSNVENAIAKTCREVQRERSKVTLIAVSKSHGVEAIKKAYDLGIRDFGENYAQELIAKSEFFEAQGVMDIRWHFLGALQRNKIKAIASHVTFIHSLGSIKHAHYCEALLNKPVRVFLQLNFRKSDHRQGFCEEELMQALPLLATFQNLHIEGLMTITPLDPAFSSAYWFQKMEHLRKKILAEGLLETVNLSMGMSNDFVEALRYGSNFLRIGTEIFGPRH